MTEVPRAQAADQHGLPALRALPAPDGRGEHRRSDCATRTIPHGEYEQRSRRGAGAGALGASRPAIRHQLSGGQRQRVALARALALEPAGAAARRAARRPRPEAAQGGAGRAQEPAARARHHLRLRHPRPGGGADDERPDRGDERAAASSSWTASSQVFEYPQTEFVAQFMGASNFFTATVRGIAEGFLSLGDAGRRRPSACRIRRRLAAGEEVRFVVRPEKLDLRAAISRPRTASPRCAVTIEDRVYQGVTTVWVVRDARPASASSSTSRTSSRSRSAASSPSAARAYLCWNPRHTVLMADRRDLSAAAASLPPRPAPPRCLRRATPGRHRLPPGAADLGGARALLPSLPLVIMLVISFGQRGTYGGLKPIEDLVGLRRAPAPSSPTIGARSSRSTSRSTGARCGWRWSPPCSAWW